MRTHSYVDTLCSSKKCSYFDSISTGQLNAKLFEYASEPFSSITDSSLVFNSNIDKIESGIGFHFSIVIATLISTICSIIVAFFIQWQLTLIIVCTIPLAYVATRLFSKVRVQFAREAKGP